METPEWDLCVERLTGEELVRFGPILDQRPAPFAGRTVATQLAEKLLCIRSRSGIIGALSANEVQLAFEARRSGRDIVLKARQVGLTTWTSALFFLKTITHPGTLALQVAHTHESAEEIFRIVHRFLENMPPHLRRGALRTSRANARQIVFPDLDSQYRVVSAGERNAGRGLTVQYLHCSELARWPGDPGETLAGLRAALAPDGEQILESTPDGVGGCFYEEWQNAGETGMTRHFFPWWTERRYRTKAVDEASLTDEERELRARAGLSLAQIGFRRKIQANFRGLARQEYAEDDNSCFRASGDSVFELDSVERRMMAVPEPIKRRRNEEIEIWLPPVGGNKYLIAVDPAGGGSDGDFSVAEVLDMNSGLQCAEFAGHVGGLELARVVTDLAKEYNDAWVVVERNNHGAGVLALIESVCHYPRVFREAGKAGWLTNSVNRPAIIGRFNAFIIDRPDCLMSKKLLAECRSFVRFRDGSTGARGGAHDDRVMAMAIGLAARAELLENAA